MRGWGFCVWCFGLVLRVFFVCFLGFFSVCFVFRSDAAACENLVLATEVKMTEFASIQMKEEEKTFHFESVSSSIKGNVEGKEA